MITSTTFRLNHRTWLIAAISAAYSTTSFAAAGKIEFAVGDVVALNSNGATRTLGKGAEIDAGDTIQTQGGRAQVRFSDGGYISLQPNTEFKVEDYSFSGKTDGSEKGFFNLVKGGLRAITGAIGHGANKSAYRVNTPVATIGIRGTEFLAQYDTRLLVSVGDGAVYLQNQGGDLTLFKGQSGEVGAEGSKPQHTDDKPAVGAAGPGGGTPNQTQQEQQQNQQYQNTFVAGDIKTEDGRPCSTDAAGGGCSTLGLDNDVAAQIQAFHDAATPMYGAWVSEVSTVGSYEVSSTLYAEFRTYEASAFVNLSQNSGSNATYIYQDLTFGPSGKFSSISGSGHSGSFDYGSGGGVTGCGSGCSLDIHSIALSGAGLTKASMTFSVINDNDGSLNITRHTSNMIGGVGSSSESSIPSGPPL